MVTQGESWNQRTCELIPHTSSCIDCCPWIFEGMEEASAEGSRDERETGDWSRGRLPIPLNSKRLTAAHLKRLVRALDVPTTAAGDEIRQMVEGKLSEAGREP